MKMSKRKSIYCRVCLRTDSRVKRKCISLFVKHNDCFIFEIINSIADVKIQKGDGLPNKICPDCLLELDTAVGFKSKCESSNILLKTTIISNLHLESSQPGLKSESIKSLNEIKKEELEETEEYLEAEFLDEGCEYPDEENDDKTDVNFGLETSQTAIQFETKPDESLGDNTIVKKSRAIDLKLECNECGGFFKSKCKMKVHWKKVHMYESLLCPLCKRAFKSYRAFHHHKKQKTQACVAATKTRIEGIGRSRVFHCKKCHYSSRRIKDMDTHSVIHTGERRFVCNLCSRGFSQQSSLQGHMETKHKMYRSETTCVYCGKYLKGRDKIYKHMKSHSNILVQCDICKKFLKSKYSLIEHLKRHSGVKSYTCDQCAKTFYVMSELCNHKRTIHEKGKHIYTCDICGYKALSSKVIKIHKAKHTSTNLPCMECGMFLEDAQKLANHQLRHFGENRLPCPHCEKKYMNRKSLSKHVRDVHKCRFLQSRPIKQETESLCSSVNQYCPDNIIEVEVPLPP